MALESKALQKKGDHVMKRITAFALFTLTSLFTAGNALALDHALQANVPFDFTISGKTLPAGTYTITSVSSNVIQIRSRDGHYTVFTTTFADGKHAAGGGKLVFDKYGERYFLSEVLCPSAEMSLAIPTSKLEKSVRMEEARLHSNGGTHALV